jgi:hypothetical protein
MHRLCRITVPGLSIESDFAAARERLLAEFPNVHEVIATTAPATLLVLYSGCAEADAWVDALLDSIQTGQVKADRRLSNWRNGNGNGNGSPANGRSGNGHLWDGDSAA